MGEPNKAVIGAPRDTSPWGGLETVARFERYEELQDFIDGLSDEGFPVEELVVVGGQLKYIEKVTGRLNALKATSYGALFGLWFGALFGLLFGIIFSPTGTTLFAIVLYWLVVGTMAGAIVGLVGYGVVGRRRSYTSDLGIRPAFYELLADPVTAAKARRRLGGAD